MPLELKPVFPVKEFWETKKQSSLNDKIIGYATRFLEKYFGTSLFLDMPVALQETSPSLFSAIETLEKLQNYGIVKELKSYSKFSDEPYIHGFYLSTQKTKSTVSGTNFFSKKTAVWNAIEKAVARDFSTTNNSLLEDTIYLPYEKISNQAINIFHLVSFSEKQRATLPHLRFNEQTIFGWVPAVSLCGHISKKYTLCPAQLINYSYFHKHTAGQDTTGEPILRPYITTGVASTFGTLEKALVKGILEVIEKDAYVISYLNKLSPPVIDFEYLSFQDEDLEKVYKMFRRYKLEVYLVKLPTDFSVNVISAIILDPSNKGPVFTIGNSAGFDLKSAILDALNKALTTRLSLKNDWEIKKMKKLPNPQKSGYTDRMIYWAKPENAPALEFMTQGEKIKIDLSSEQNFFDSAERSNNKKYHQNNLKKLLSELQKKSYEACYVDLSDMTTKKLGLHCIHIIIPELQSIHPRESFSYCNNKRLREIPPIFGYTPAKKLNSEPYPFG